MENYRRGYGELKIEGWSTEIWRHPAIHAVLATQAEISIKIGILGFDNGKGVRAKSGCSIEKFKWERRL
jgi:hypothetical protein